MTKDFLIYIHYNYHCNLLLREIKGFIFKKCDFLKFIQLNRFIKTGTIVIRDGHEHVVGKGEEWQLNNCFYKGV